MSEPVKLKKIVETLELANDIFSSYLDKKTGEITSIPGDAYSVSQGEDAIMADVEIHASDVEFAKKVVEDEQRYVALPSQFDIHEWEIMRDFSISREDEDVSQALMNAIHGSGAFRYFKDKIFELGIRDDWFDFRKKTLYNIARKWCERNDIDYINE